MKPLLSIVIANYNYGRFLDEAIQSVIAQNMGNQVELIICDAVSTDSSVDIIKKYGKTIEGFANNLIPKSNPTAVDPEPRRYKVQWKRDEWKQYPLFIFGPCIMGVVETMLPGLYAHKQIRSTDVKPKTATATKSTTTSADTKSSAKTTDTKTTTQTDKSTKTKKQTKKAK